MIHDKLREGEGPRREKTDRNSESCDRGGIGGHPVIMGINGKERREGLGEWKMYDGRKTVGASQRGKRQTCTESIRYIHF